MLIFANYLIQARDARTGEIGDFIFDVSLWQETGRYHSVSPVFECLSELFAWGAASGHPAAVFPVPISRSK